ncbi:CxxH/CxxC protein [Alkalihalobacillus sp. CinArs1]|uniref:CxxH/CxxC protein n=1 Tax=Alkalihalobacillus sp. CinArs1 TaxID=2995314 RepID=UPI0022DE5E55|nr:CxxH/CxxC protein [Alkalihalobacillus sp. CinArs1]
MKIHCCEEHVELALDVTVDETEQFPVLEKLEKNDGNLSTTCKYCSKPAVYMVSN